HHSFGVEAPEEYLKNLPAAHTAHADNAKNAEPLDEETDAALRALDRDLVRWIRSLAPGQNLTLGEAEFTP
ncbi:MAG: hypothetical protein ACREKL_15830, partial [Chthoniobacterales bacterium]